MARTPKLTTSLLVRVIETAARTEVTIQDLRSGEVRRFASWRDAVRYAKRRLERAGLK